MFRKNKKNEASSFAQWKAKKTSEKKSKELGRRLRELIYYRSGDNAATGEALEIINLHGDDPLVMNSNRLMCWTPIFLSVIEKHHDLTRALMHAPALNVNVQDYRGSTILIYTMMECYPNHELIKYLLTHPDLNLNLKTKQFHESFFIRSGPEVPMYRGASALFCATSKEEFFQYIPVILDRLGTAEDDAVNCLTTGYSSGYSYLETRSPLTNLVKAIGECKPEQRALLLSCIERIANAKHDTHKKSSFASLDEALMIAARNGDRQVAEILLAAGANKEANHVRAYDVARFAGHKELGEYIRLYSPSLEQQFETSNLVCRK